MSEVFENLGAFVDRGLTFPDHTVYIWSAYAVSFFVLAGLVVWTQGQIRYQKKVAKSLEGKRKKVT